MNTHAEAQSNHNPEERPASHRREGGNGDVGFARRAKAFAKSASATAAGLASQFDGQLKRKPYATLGVTCALGVAVGVVLSSRVLRAVLTATLSVAALELARTLVRQGVARGVTRDEVV
jgi:hypothetical protein